MKRLVLLLCLLAPACAPPVTLTTPQGQTAYRADQVVLRVNELQNAAITAERGGAIPTATTRRIVQFCVAADKTLAATPAGWPATVLALWRATKADLPPATFQQPPLAAALSAVETLLGSLQ